MTARMGRMSDVSHFLHRHLLKLIVLSYGLAAVCPAPGLWIKDAEILDVAGSARRPGDYDPPEAPALAPAVQRRDAGPGRPGRADRRRPGVMLAGLATNLVVPLLFLAVMVPALRAWHNPDEAAIVLVGLALVTAMPIAGSSTGWAQAADGDMALSLGLVLGLDAAEPADDPRLAPRPRGDRTGPLRRGTAPPGRAGHRGLPGGLGAPAVGARGSPPARPSAKTGPGRSSGG